jgi:phosphopantetheine adenylyltransferase
MFIRDLYEAPAKRIVAIMAGGFHPFHPGHKSLYDWSVKTFGKENVYVAATNDTITRPFPFDVKKKLASMAGVPADRFIQINTSPFNVKAYTNLLDDNTALVFIRSDKDRNEEPLPDKMKIDRKTKQLTNEPRYIRSWTGKDVKTHDEMGYIAYGPTIDFDFSGMQIKSASELRATWPNMSDEDKHKAATLMYGDGHDEAVQLLDKALGGSDKDLDEWAAPALKGVLAVSKIAKFFWNNKWAIGFLTATWKVYPWIRDAAKWANRFLDHPVTQALGRYGLPAVGIAVALYGGTKLYNELIKTKNEKELEKVLIQFEPDKNELEDLIAEFEKLTKEEQPVKEADVVVDKSSLVPYIKNLIMDYLDKEQDVEKLSKLLKMMVGREIKTRGGKRYTITRKDIDEALQKNG